MRTNATTEPPRGPVLRRFLRAALVLALACAGADAAGKPPAKKPAPKPAPVVRTAGGLPVSSKYRSPRNAQRKLRKSTRFIVLHTTEGAAKGSLEKLSANGECHYVVDEGGAVWSIVDKGRIAFHAGLSMWDGRTDLDGCSVGIEIVGRHDKEITAAQYATLRKLLAELKATYKIPDSRVLTHSMVAYGNANHWHKYRHRGRKRCGMLFAMPSVRAKLGLTARPASDPDVKAKRLVQVDSDLAAVLYGTRDTMAAHYNRRPPPVVMRAAPSKSPPKSTGRAGSPSAPQPQPAPGRAGAPRPQPLPPKQIITVTQPPIVKPAQPIVKPIQPPIVKPAQPIVKQPSAVTPPPIVKPAHPKQVEQPPEEEGVLASIGGFFKSTAKLIVPKKKQPPDAPGRAGAPRPSSEPAPRPPFEPAPARKLERPPQVLSRDPRDLAALEAMPGYVKGGPVSAELTPYGIAGAAWRLPTTYYYMNGRIVTGDKVNEKLIEKGAYIFYKK
jgi:N-acetyl-anhydromuramyl-L-alanine amidase AmpD